MEEALKNGAPSGPTVPPLGLKHNLDSGNVELGNLSQDELYFDCGMRSVKHLLTA